MAGIYRFSFRFSWLHSTLNVVHTKEFFELFSGLLMYPNRTTISTCLPELVCMYVPIVRINSNLYTEILIHLPGPFETWGVHEGFEGQNIFSPVLWTSKLN